MTLNIIPRILAVTAFSVVASVASAQAVLFSENFDTDPTASWAVNSYIGGTTSTGGLAANAASFFFDYSTVGIPAAPNSSGGTTRGLKLQANITGTGPAGGFAPGISVSPIGQSFTGDYSLRFDWWTNFIGNTSGGIGNSSGGSGSTQLSTFGILTSGTVANYVGSSDCVFYGATPDGGSASDYRAYSITAQSGYTTGTIGVNSQNVYAAGSQANTNAYYADPFPGGRTAPSVQQTNYPLTQSGTTLVGTPSFQWNDVLIEKNGSTITWTVNGSLLATTFTSGFATAPNGNNILFGQADTSIAAGTPASTFQAVDFTLIDNVRVLAVPEPGALELVAGAAAASLPLVIRWRRRRA